MRFEHALESKHKIYKLRDSIQALRGAMTVSLLIHRQHLTFLPLSALISADRVLIPFDCDVFSKRALQTLIENVIETQDDHNNRLRLKGLGQSVPVSGKTSREVVQQLKDEGLPVLESMLPPSVLMKESHQKNLPFDSFGI